MWLDWKLFNISLNNKKNKFFVVEQKYKTCFVLYSFLIERVECVFCVSRMLMTPKTTRQLNQWHLKTAESVNSWLSHTAHTVQSCHWEVLGTQNCCRVSYSITNDAIAVTYGTLFPRLLLWQFNKEFTSKEYQNLQ